MHAWASNLSEVLPTVRTNYNGAEKEMKLCDRGGERVLGLYWDTTTDRLKFNAEFSKIPKEILNGEKLQHNAKSHE